MRRASILVDTKAIRLVLDEYGDDVACAQLIAKILLVPSNDRVSLQAISLRDVSLYLIRPGVRLWLSPFFGVASTIYLRAACLFGEQSTD